MGYGGKIQELWEHEKKLLEGGNISCLKGKWEMGERAGELSKQSACGSWLGCAGEGNGSSGPQPGCGVQSGVQTPYSLCPWASHLNSWGLSSSSIIWKLSFYLPCLPPGVIVL